MSADFNFDELSQLAADLGEVPKKTGPKIRAALNVTSIKVKLATRDSLKGASSQWQRLAGAVDYEVTTFQGFGASVFKSEIGYNDEKVLPTKKPRPGSKKKIGPGTAGNLGNLREYGKPGLAPHNDLLKALEKNQDDFKAGLDIAIAQALKESGL